MPLTVLLSPLMTDDMMITVSTPITMPSTVSPLRSLLARSVSSEMVMVSRTSERFIMRHSSTP